MGDITTKRGPVLKKIVNYAAVYLVWIFSSAIAMYAMIKSWEDILLVYTALGWSRWGRNAVSNFSIIILGIICLVMVLIIQHYYEEGLKKGQLPKRILRVTLIEAVVLVAVFIIRFVAI